MASICSCNNFTTAISKDTIRISVNKDLPASKRLKLEVSLMDKRVPREIYSPRKMSKGKNDSGFMTSDDEGSLSIEKRPLSQPPSPGISSDPYINSTCEESDSSASKELIVISNSDMEKKKQAICNKVYRRRKEKRIKDKPIEIKEVKVVNDQSEKSNNSWLKPALTWTRDTGHSDELFYSPVTNQSEKNKIFTSLSPNSPNLRPNSELDQREINFRQRQSNKFNSSNFYNLDEVKNLKSDVKFIDTHCHLDFLFKQTNFRSNSHLAFQRQHKDGYPSCYEGCVAIFCDPKTFRENMWKQILAEENIWAAFGCHPHKADFYNDDTENDMISALKHPKVVAFGEIGLDYSNRNNANHEKQKEIFQRQLRIAINKKLPLVIHSRDATEDTLNIMKGLVPKDYKIHRHCFTGHWAEAKIWLNEFPNLYLGLTSLVTFPHVKEVHEVARNIPLDRLLLETDAPYFLPRLESKEKKRSHPGMAIHVAAQIAFLRSEPLETILRITRNNTKIMYGI